MRRWINGVLLAALAAILLQGAMKFLQGPKFEVGQRWTLEVDARYEDVSGLIVKIDPDPDFGQVIFIDIEGLRDIEGRPSSLMFVPVSRRALRRSIVRFVEKTEEEPFYIESFYDNWRVRRMTGDQAVWTRPVREELLATWP